jgi:hypothetical protein
MSNISDKARSRWERIAAANDGKSPVPPGGLCPVCSLPGKVNGNTVTCIDDGCNNTWNMGEGKGLG